MSFNGSGTFVINSAGQPVVSGTVISSTAFNALTADLANGLSTCITKDGQTTPTADIPMGSNKITGLGNGTAAGDAANLGQVQSTVAKLLGSVSGADTITAVGSPTVAAYAAGQMFYFVATAANTGAVTINIDSLGAKSITRDGTTALAAGDIQSGEVCVIVYDGTQFQLVNGASQSAAIVTNSLTVNGTSSLDGAVTINDSGADVDFRVEGDTVENALFVQGSDGYVGVGTNAPSYPFHVVGSGDTVTAVTGGATSVAALNLGNSTNLADGGIRYDNSTDALIFRANNGEKARISSSGNLGVGTTSPDAKIEIEAADGVEQFRLQRVSTSIWGSLLPSSESGALGLAFNANDGNASTPGFVWRTATDGSTYTERMRLTTTGLGIGATSPGAQLEVSRSATDGYSTIRWSNTGASGRTYEIGLGGNTAAAGFANNLYFYDSTASATRMVIDASGNLGVGTTSPSSGYRLTVNDTTNSYLKICNGTTGSTGSDGFDLAAIGSDAYLIQRENAPMIFYTNATERAQISAAGEVLINASGTSSSALLFVNGVGKVVNPIVAKVDNNAYYNYVGENTSGNVTFFVLGTGDVKNTNNSYGAISDEKMKQDIVDASSQWDDIKGLRVRKFRYKADPTAPLQIGVVAQELETVSPGLVDEHPDYEEVEVTDEEGNVTTERQPTGTSTKSVKYSVLYMKAIKALQEAMTRIEALEAEVAALKGAN